MGKNIGKTGMGGAGKLKEEGQIKKELWGPYIEWRGGYHRGVASSLAAHKQHNLQRRLTVNPWSQHEEGTAPPARASQNET